MSSGDAERAADIVAAMGDATLLRSVAAVIVGFVVLTLGSVGASRLVGSVTGVEAGPGLQASLDRSFFGLNLGSRLLVAVLAGYLTARAAPRRPFLHGLALAGLVTFFGLAAIAGLNAAGGAAGPAWYPWAMLVAGPGGILGGAALRRSDGEARDSGGASDRSGTGAAAGHDAPGIQP